MSSTHWRWSDATRARDALAQRPAAGRLVQLLARLPLLSERVIEQMAGLQSGAAPYRQLQRLQQDALLDWIRPPLRDGNSPRLWYLTDLGLATVALVLDCDPWKLARSNHLRRRDLLARLPELRHLHAAYELLGFLAASRNTSPNLLAWERPWRRHIVRSHPRSRRLVSFRAFVSLAWESQPEGYLLLPDLATVPLRYFRPAVAGLFALRAAGLVVPVLLIATSHAGRWRAWAELIDRVRAQHGEEAYTVSSWSTIAERWAPAATARNSPPTPIIWRAGVISETTSAFRQSWLSHQTTRRRNASLAPPGLSRSGERSHHPSCSPLPGASRTPAIRWDCLVRSGASLRPPSPSADGGYNHRSRGVTIVVPAALSHLCISICEPLL